MSSNNSSYSAPNRESLQKSNRNNERGSFVNSSYVSHLRPLNPIQKPPRADLCASKRSRDLSHLMHASDLARVCLLCACLRMCACKCKEWNEQLYTCACACVRACVHLTLRHRQLAKRSPTPGGAPGPVSAPRAATRHRQCTTHIRTNISSMCTRTAEMSCSLPQWS